MASKRRGCFRSYSGVCFSLCPVESEGLCHQPGLGDEPRKVFHNLSQIKLTNVILPTRNGKEIRLRCVGSPTQHQRILLQNLKLNLPQRFSKYDL